MQNTEIREKFLVLTFLFVPYQVNEIAWNMTGDMFFLTTGNGKKRNFEPFVFLCWRGLSLQLQYLFSVGTVEVLAYPSLKAVDTLMAHTAGCYCIAIDPVGKYVSDHHLYSFSLCG